MTENAPTTPLVIGALYHAMVPVEVPKVSVLPAFGIHKPDIPVILPATDGSKDVTLYAVVTAEGQAPLLSNTRYQLLSVRLDCVRVFSALVAKVGAMTLPRFDQFTLSVDCCHWMLPTVPLANVRVAVLVPEQTEAVPEIVLVTTKGLTVTTNALVGAVHEPTVETAR